MLSSLTAIAALLGTTLALGGYRCRHLLPLWSSDRKVKLDFSPAKLSDLDIAVILLLLLFRSIRHSLAAVFGCSSRHVDNATAASDQDELSLTIPLQISPADFDAYAKATKSTADVSHGWNSSQALFFLSALTEPAMLLLLARSSCKLRPLGAVNVRNRFELFKPTLCTREALLSLGKAVVTARLSNRKRIVKRGLEVDLWVSLDIPSKDFGESVAIFRQRFTILQFTKVQADFAKKVEEQELIPGNTTFDPVQLTLDYNDPTLWARICKDYNPIHTSAIAAKALGFQGRLAHGNHIGALAATYMAAASENDPLCMEINFRRPVIVPSKLVLSMFPVTMGKKQSDLIAFEVLHRDKRCIEGKVGCISDMVVAD
ncbi:hypothetical protein H2200_008841 [Cladophialophora chaetospira]|uniref:MaoC-like domain-containing protein n=1 Tax=Cladophialophora chaetospira TaxID=386627 RepID=A0AA38X4U4_9EURO|nr:hypothetical protein H2200_008841 [Cladophialophora chaetospira]